MTRHLRLLGLIAIAMFALFAAPTAGVAQTPVQDQYQPTPDADTNPADDTGAVDTDPAGDAAPGADSDTPPVAVQQGSSGGNLPFTGGSVPLIALIGLLLLAAGLVGAATLRTRDAPDSS